MVLLTFAWLLCRSEILRIGRSHQERLLRTHLHIPAGGGTSRTFYVVLADILGYNLML
jgi:hypothetical protein